MGRPPKLQPDETTIKSIEALASVGATQHEAAAYFKVSPRTFDDFLRNQKKARESWDRGAQNMKLSVRRLQFKSAQAGNVTMQIWLGKQYLGQKDKQEVENTGKDGGPIQTNTTLTLDEAGAERVRKSLG